MWFTDVVRDTISRMKPTIPWRKTLSREETREYPAEPAVADNVSQEEFCFRYTNALHVQWTLLMFVLGVSAVLVLFVESLLGLTITLLALLVYLLLYLRTAYTVWTARQIWVNWEKRGEPSPYTLRDFFAAVLIEPGELLPRKLDPKQDTT